MERRLYKVLRAGQAHVARCGDDEDAARSATRASAASAASAASVASAMDAVFRGHNLDMASLILAAIGQDENQNKLAACQAAQNWCVAQSRKNGHNPCTDETLSLGWTELAKRVFGTTGLVYDAWKVPSNPKENFYSLCYATGLADVVAKHFTLKMIPKVRQDWERCFQESWNDGSYAALASYNSTPPLSYKETQERDYPIINLSKSWEFYARRLYKNAPSKEVFEILCEADHQQSHFISAHEFGPLLDVLVVGTATLLLDGNVLQDFDDHHLYSEDELGQEAAIRQEARLHRVASELSIHAVSLWKKSNALNNHSLSREKRDKITRDILEEQRVAFVDIVKAALADSPQLLKDVPPNLNDDFWPSQIQHDMPWSLGTDIVPLNP